MCRQLPPFCFGAVTVKHMQPISSQFEALRRFFRQIADHVVKYGGLVFQSVDSISVRYNGQRVLRTETNILAPYSYESIAKILRDVSNHFPINCA